jgi:hypothetical protein
MNRRRALTFIAVGFFISESAGLSGDAAIGYPEYPAADIALTIIDGRIHLSSAAAAHYQVTFRSSETMEGFWDYASQVVDFTSSKQFFRAVINPGYVFFESSFWRVDLLGVRMPGNEAEFSTQSGFRLKLHDSWFDGISIYHIESGPSSGDARTDYLRLFDELLADPRTGFLTPIDTSLSMGAPGSGPQICYLGITDELFLQPRVPDFTDEEFAKFDLEVINRAGYSTKVRWTKPKSMHLAEFIEKLRAAGIEGDFIATACPL